MTQESTIRARSQKMANVISAIMSFFSGDDAPEWKGVSGAAGPMSGGRHQTRKLEKSRRRMRRVSQRRNRV